MSNLHTHKHTLEQNYWHNIYFFNAKQKESISSIVLDQKTLKSGEIEYFLYFKIARRVFLADREILKWENGLWGDAKSILGASRDFEEVESRHK